MAPFLMIKSRTTRNIILTVTLCFAAPHWFAHIAAYWALLLVPSIQALGATSKIGVTVVMGAMNILGALLAASLMSIPFGWLVRERPAVYGGIVGVVTSIILYYWVYIFVPPIGQYWPQRVEQSALPSVLSTIEYFSFVAGCMFFSVLGARIGRRKSA